MAQSARPEFKLSRLLIAGSFVHLLATVTVYTLGRCRVVPEIILPNGVLGGDSMVYFERSVTVGSTLSTLSNSNEQIHVRLYALSSAVLSPVVGTNIFSIELISLPLYLAAFFLVYKIGRDCFGPGTGFGASLAVGLMPSFLIHATQPLRDPLFVVLMLALLWLLLRIITKSMTAGMAVVYTACGCLSMSLLWLVRDSLWPVYVGVLILALVALIAASIKYRRTSLANFACLLLLLAQLMVIPTVLSRWLPLKEPLTLEQEQRLGQFTNRQLQGGQTGFPLKIAVMRQKFLILYEGAGSNIDRDRNFADARAIVAYLPRAIVIGMFSPFPAYWFQKGEVFGLLGRMIAGLETCFIYILTPFVLFAVWYFRRRVEVWFLLSVVLLGTLALGLVVVNLGALYRMRYCFWMVFIILGVSSLVRIRLVNSAIDFIGSSKKQNA